MKNITWIVAATMSSMLVLASCDGGGEDSGPTQTSVAPSPQTDGQTATMDAGAVTQDDDTTATSVGPSAIVQRAPVPCEDATGEPAELEASLLVEPGPYSGDSFDAEAAARGVIAQNPSTDQEWADAALSQVQGDYAETVCEMMVYTDDMGDASAGPTAGPGPESEPVGENHFALVLDASGSMAAQASSGTQMDEAKAAIRTFVDELPASSTVSLRIYGHEGDNTEAGKEESCASSEVVYQGAPDDAGFTDALDQVQPVGYTPLATAIEDAEDDIPEDATDAVMYVVSDGIETCGGDPVQAATTVAESGINPIINVIGFHVDNADQAALREIAEAGGGTFTTADSSDELTAYWREEHQQLQRAWQDWRAEERERLRGVVRDKLDSVWDLANTMRASLREDRSAVRDVLRAVQGQDAIDRETLLAATDLALAHLDEANAYTNDFLNHISSTGDNYRAGLRDVYEQGDTRWTDFYREQTGGDD